MVADREGTSAVARLSRRWQCHSMAEAGIEDCFAAFVGDDLLKRVLMKCCHWNKIDFLAVVIVAIANSVLVAVVAVQIGNDKSSSIQQLK